MDILYAELTLCAGLPDPGLPHGPAALPPGLPDLSHHRGELRLDLGRCHLLVAGE